MAHSLVLDTPHAGKVRVRSWQADTTGQHIEVEAQALAHRKYWLNIAHLHRVGNRLVDMTDRNNPVMLRRTVEV